MRFECLVSIKAKNGKEINVTALVDGGCEGAELVLLDEDVAQLGIPIVDTAQVGTVDMNAPPIKVKVYEDVIITIRFSDGSFAHANVSPIVMPSPVADAQVGVVVSGKRLAGYGAMFKLGVKQDFKSHKLVRLVRKL